MEELNCNQCVHLEDRGDQKYCDIIQKYLEHSDFTIEPQKCNEFYDKEHFVEGE